MSNEIIRPDIYEITKEAVKDGLAIIRQWETDKKLVYQYFQFPIMGEFPSGYPDFRKSQIAGDEGPLDYESVFRRERYPPEDIPSWRRFWDFAHEDEYLQHFWEIGSHVIQKWYSGAFPDWSETHSRVLVYGSLAKLVDRYIHITGKKDMLEDLFQPLYQEWERSIFWEGLPVNIVVPILGVVFSYDRMKINNMISVERMGKPLQLARNNRNTYTISTHGLVIGMATHSLILRGWTLANKTLDRRHESLKDIGSYSVALTQIEEFFAVLRSETLVDTGFGQIIVTPIGWGDSWQAYLPHVDVIAIREYPAQFENYGWLRTPPTVEKNTCRKVAKLFGALGNTSENRLILAAKRLNAAFLRTNEGDSIIDITIGLETLLTSDTQTEITYRLAMRAAALSTIEKFDEFSPSEICKACKKVYEYRSAVIHGTKKANKKWILKLNKEKEIPIIRLGIRILSCVIRAMVLHQEYLDVDKLDMLLITKKSRKRKVTIISTNRNN